MTRAILFAPGRGSYTEKSLGSLPADHPWVLTAEELRASYGLDSLVELDGASRFSPAKHLKPRNVSALIYLRSMLDGARALSEYEVVAIGGNSMGWYTALAMAGALSFEDGFRLVQEMALIQEEVGGGGQAIYPVVDETWNTSPKHVEAVHTLIERDPEIFPSIHLGGYEVLGASPAAMSRVLEGLPKVTLGKTTYPFRLALHGPYHTPLVRAARERAETQLASLDFRRPAVTLVDGKGRRFTPWSADEAELAAYTLGDQVDTPYDFTASVRVALLEYAPDRIVLAGPGNSLGGVVAQILIANSWRGLGSREDFSRLQESEHPILESMDR
ncbi:MAG TPA: ACP S-malonyltransferase [Planctomycetes bacterium]|nr:ACP S-malonyltransferase [Planctomycetota bacterium]